ncbi:MDR family MFS transporter [Cryptosporangium phraense]|uniref:MFS transporter n=1 Tax=Cryptosporangium phraense TaxID=2593070 RepID=A0A545ANJ8_9ACTN|nr:MDR family MFS transporter [Cryptosporangium phraense]TQS42866.1 MFS transporter [Cryptosporangium phraense]
MAAPSKPVEAASETLLTHRQILLILTGLMSGMFLAALDQTIVASSIRTIADDLDGLSLQAWATTAYLITATITTPLYGKLSDLYGRKPFFLGAIGLFLVGSALSAASQSMYELAAFRAVQGLGAGGLFSLALAILGDIVPPRERARYQGFFLAVFGTSSVLGPVIGGTFAGQDTILWVSGWRWVFLVNVPIGLVALMIVMRVLNIPHQRREHRIDWPGALALVVGLVPLLIVAEQGRIWGWGSGRSIVCFVIGAIGLVLFILAERRCGEDALIPLRFFRNSVFTTTSLVALVTGMGMFGGLAALPLYLQIVKGASPTQAGLLLLPLTAGIMTGSIISGQLISRTGRYKIFPIIGTVLMTVGLLAFSQVHWDTPFWQTGIVMAIFGLGLGNVMQPVTLAVQNAMPPRDIGVATSSSTFFRQMGGTLGTAVFLSVLFSQAGTKIGSAFSTIVPTPSYQAALHDPQVLADPANQRFVEQLSSGSGFGGALDDSSFINQLDERLAKPFFVGFSDAVDQVFLLGAAIMVVAIVLAFLIKEIPLRTQSGVDAARAEARAAEEGSN